MTAPVVRIFDAVTPENAGQGAARLSYPEIGRLIDDYDKTSPERARAVWEAPLGSAEEAIAARHLAGEYFVKGVGKLVLTPEGGDRELWSQRYNQAAAELYNLPDGALARSLIATHRHEIRKSLSGSFAPTQASERLLAIYDDLLPESAWIENRRPVSAETKHALYVYERELRTRYGYVFDSIKTAGKDKFAPADLHEFFTDALVSLTDHGEEGWEAWRVVMKKASILSVNAQERLIEIGEKRAPGSAKKLEELTAHELFVHGLRANNAYNEGDEALIKGLPGFDGFEEGLGKLAEHAISGNKSPASADHYVDIAVASGAVNGRQHTRHEVYDLALARKIVRAQMKGDYGDDKLPAFAKTTAASVDRIFYGTPGDAVPASQAVFIKETAYYGGYVQALRYIINAQESGTPGGEIFDHISKGRFDPTNTEHDSYVGSL